MSKGSSCVLDECTSQRRMCNPSAQKTQKTLGFYSPECDNIVIHPSNVYYVHLKIRIATKLRFFMHC